MMFWRDLDLGDELRVRQSTAVLPMLDRLDCLVAWYSGDSVRFDVSSSARINTNGRRMLYSC